MEVVDGLVLDPEPTALEETASPLGSDQATGGDEGKAAAAGPADGEEATASDPAAAGNEILENAKVAVDPDYIVVDPEAADAPAVATVATVAAGAAGAAVDAAVDVLADRFGAGLALADEPAEEGRYRSAFRVWLFDECIPLNR